MGLIYTITGIRDLAQESEAIVAERIARLMSGTVTLEIRFGCAIGSDTCALMAAGRRRGQQHRLVGYVPFTIWDQPQAARLAAKLHCDTIHELKLPIQRGKAAYLDRNKAMVMGEPGTGQTDFVIAFTDGKERGGTWRTMNLAWDAGIQVECCMVKRK
jgi:hypothetical protein